MNLNSTLEGIITIFASYGIDRKLFCSCQLIQESMGRDKAVNSFRLINTNFQVIFSNNYATRSVIPSGVSVLMKKSTTTICVKCNFIV